MTAPKTFTVAAELQAMGNTGPISELKYYIQLQILGGSKVKLPIPKECLPAFDFDSPIEVTIRSTHK
jgi:hypothetical protein